MHQVQTLGQKLSYKEKGLADYACNRFARAIAAIDVMIKRYNALGIDTTELRAKREETVALGTAIFISNSDILTQLSVRVGKTGSKEPRSGSR